MKLSRVFWILSMMIWIATSAFTFAITYDSNSISFNYTRHSERYPTYEVEILIVNVTHKGLLFDAYVYLQVTLLDASSNILLKNNTSTLIHPGQKKTLILRLKITSDIATAISAYSIKLQLSLIKVLTWISYSVEIVRKA